MLNIMKVKMKSINIVQYYNIVRKIRPKTNQKKSTHTLEICRICYREPPNYTNIKDNKFYSNNNNFTKKRNEHR